MFKLLLIEDIALEWFSCHKIYPILFCIWLNSIISYVFDEIVFDVFVEIVFDVFDEIVFDVFVEQQGEGNRYIGGL